MNKRERFLCLLRSQKPVLGMLHLKGGTDADVLRLAIPEAECLLENGVDALLVENYFGTPAQVEQVLRYIKRHMPDALCGVNVLNDNALGFALARGYDLDFIQLDSVSGHLPPDREPELDAFLARERAACSSCVLGGVRFKYQPYLSGRPLEEDLRAGMRRCDAVVVTGDATGKETDLEKIRTFRRVLGDFPLIIGAGMTPDNAQAQLALADGAIVGSYFKDTYRDTGDVCAAHVRLLMAAVQKARGGHAE